MKVANSNEIIVSRYEWTENCKTSATSGLQFRYFVEKESAKSTTHYTLCAVTSCDTGL